MTIPETDNDIANDDSHIQPTAAIAPSKERVAFHQITFTSWQVTVLALTIISAFAGVIWFLYKTGSFAPDVQLGQQASISQYAYEKATGDFRDAMKQNRDLQENISKVSAELENMKGGIELKRLEVEERIAVKKSELETQAKLAEATARQKEAEARLKMVELEQKHRTTQSENERLAALVAACVSATTPGESKAEQLIMGAGTPIATLAQAQDGSLVLKKCLAEYYELITKQPTGDR